MDDKHNTGESEIEAQITSLRRTERNNRLKWAMIGITSAAVSVGLFSIFWNNQAYFFRPKPDMEEVERISYQKSDDPACRSLISAIDKTEEGWKTERLSLKTLFESDDTTAILAGLKTIREHLKSVTYERRRVQIIITKDPNVVSDIARYLKHLQRYLRDMDRSLTARLIALKPALAESQPKFELPVDKRPDSVFVEGFGKLRVKKIKKDTREPEVAYNFAWSKVTGDHEKWRVFRQGAIPCGQRHGDLPAVPEEDASLFKTAPQAQPVKASDADALDAP